MMVIFAVIGVFLALHALDAEMSLFGIALAAFAAVFLLGQIRRYRSITSQQARAERQHG